MRWANVNFAYRSCATQFVSQAWKSGTRKTWLCSRGFAAYPARDKKPSGKRPSLNSEVKTWTQEFPWSRLRKAADADYPFLDDGEAHAARELGKEIAQLDRELKQMEARVRDGSFLEPALKLLPPDEQKSARAEIQEVIEHDRRARLEIQEQFPKVEVKMNVAPEHTLYLQNFNSSMKTFMSRQNEREVRMKVWQYFMRCKAFLPKFLHEVSDEAWSLLSKTLLIAQLRDDPNWALHRIALYEDMIGAGKMVDSSQKLLYVEALRDQGQHERAISQWQDMRSLVKNNELAWAQFELIGVGLFTSQGNPSKAEEIAFDYLANEPPEESRILIPILATWLERGDQIGMKHAWALYLRMKSQLGTSITMQDYDRVTIAFLRGGRADLALAIFKDMMLTGQMTGESSLELYQKAVGLMAETQSRSIKVEDINGIALTSLTFLPRKYQNRFFYGSWLKKLIGMDEVDAAAQVVELMYERGVRPDSKHLNGIIGAWMRSNHDKNHEKAERMAWSMVHERLQFVSNRGRGEVVCSAKTLPKWVPFPTHLKRTTAPANIETFCLLLQYYVTRRRDDDVQTLQRVLAAAEIPADHFFMNHLLFHEVLHGNLSAVWTKYVESFTHILPDMETFVCLWDSEKKHLERVILNVPDEYPGPRVIMREMMNWYFAQDLKRQRKAQDYFDKDLYDRIIRCMCLAKDFQGVIVAIYALRSTFKIYPDAELVKAITLDVARMGVGVASDSPTVWKPRRARKRNAQVKANVNQVDQLFEIISHDRTRKLLQYGLSKSNMTDEMHLEEGLWVLAEFLRTVMERTSIDAVNAPLQSKVEQAAAMMGVAGIDLEDPLPTYSRPGHTKRIAASLTG